MTDASRISRALTLAALACLAAVLAWPTPAWVSLADVLRR